MAIVGNIYTLNQASKAIGADRILVSFLVREKQIPFQKVGIAKVFDENGLNAIRKAVAEHQAKPEPAATS